MKYRLSVAIVWFLAVLAEVIVEVFFVAVVIVAVVVFLFSFINCYCDSHCRVVVGGVVGCNASIYNVLPACRCLCGPFRILFFVVASDVLMVGYSHVKRDETA